MKRRAITKPDSHWEEKISKALTGNKVTWGCLNQKYELFTIANFSTYHVPKHVVVSMVKSGLLKLKGDGMYQYIPPVGVQKTLVRRKLP